MVTDPQLTHSKAVQRRTGATFHLATRLLPERVRHATYVLYAFFRVADDVVDDPEPGPATAQHRTLERMRAGAFGDADARRALAEADPNATADDAAVVAACDELRRRHDIPDREVNAFVDAMCADVEAPVYDTYADLEDYVRGSSVAVGTMMMCVMDVPDEARARPHAKALAEAFQLTNFLRDVREDVRQYDRVYLPATTLAANGVTVDDVRQLAPTEGLRATVEVELHRTEALYRTGVAGIRHLPRDCRPAVLLAAVLYADQHRLIRERDHDVFTARPRLTYRRRLWLAARTWIAWRRYGDAERAFYAVSDVPREPRARATDERSAVSTASCTAKSGSGSSAETPPEPSAESLSVSSAESPAAQRGETAAEMPGESTDTGRLDPRRSLATGVRELATCPVGLLATVVPGRD